MPVPSDPAGERRPAGFRESLGRASRATFYLRVGFSVLFLVYAGFGPGLLFRTVATGANVGYEPLARFYSFRPVIYALLFVAFACVLATLARRAVDLFAVEFGEDVGFGAANSDRDRYLHYLKPSPLPFVLSGNTPIDLMIMLVALVGYSFWVVVLAESAPAGIGGYQIAGIVLGSYGLFAVLIITGLVWFGSARRIRAISRPGKAAATSGDTGGTDTVSPSR
jgi:hypothetical protein